jgi:mannose/fructose/N-acetylgalactosamine-specific phosphotransferase system component IIC
MRPDCTRKQGRADHRPARGATGPDPCCGDVAGVIFVVNFAASADHAATATEVALGFIAFCLLCYVVAITIWGAIKSKDERAKLVAEFNAKPAECLFVLLWVAAIFMFVIGIFAPIFGENEFFDTGLKIWQVGGLASLAGWIVSWFVKL